MSDTNIVKTVWFNVKPNDVWVFLTDKDKLGTWYHPAKADLAEGEEYALYDASKGPDGDAMIWGRVLEATAPVRLVTTFCIPPLGDTETTVTFALEEAAGGTRLTVTHAGVTKAAGDAALSLLMALDAGWDAHLGDLRGGVNTG